RPLVRAVAGSPAARTREPSPQCRPPHRRRHHIVRLLVQQQVLPPDQLLKPCCGHHDSWTLATFAGVITTSQRRRWLHCSAAQFAPHQPAQEEWIVSHHETSRLYRGGRPLAP